MSDPPAAPAPNPGYVTLRPSPGRKALGWGFIVLGILGCILPFLQGFLFLALGVFVLRDQYAWAFRRWAWLSGKWPETVAKIEEMEGRMSARFAGWGARLRRAFGRA